MKLIISPLEQFQILSLRLVNLDFNLTVTLFIGLFTFCFLLKALPKDPVRNKGQKYFSYIFVLFSSFIAFLAMHEEFFDHNIVASFSIVTWLFLFVILYRWKSYNVVLNRWQTLVKKLYEVVAGLLKDTVGNKGQK